MDKTIIIRWCEIHLKGKNRNYFEKLLENNIKSALNGLSLKFVKIQGRYLIEDFSEFDEGEIISRLKKVAGIHTLSIAIRVKSNFDDICKVAVETMSDKNGTFKVETRRADKTFPLHSLEVSREVGGKILASNCSLTVDVVSPQYICNVDIRESGDTLVYTDVIKGVGGMPVGSSGKGLLLISGGIDSPVAGYMMAKRGMRLDAIHFHSYPYTGEAAKEKVISLSKKVSEYACSMNLFVIKFTEIQEAIHEKCPEEFMITIMRRFMMRISEIIARQCHAQAIITGESLGQVASQTIESITTTNAVVSMPVLRPLIALDKIEIIDIANRIDTYETSILPYEDCCTVFLPKHPVIKPKLEEVLEAESKLDIDGLISNCLKQIEKIEL